MTRLFRIRHTLTKNIVTALFLLGFSYSSAFAQCTDPSGGLNPFCPLIPNQATCELATLNNVTCVWVSAGNSAPTVSTTTPASGITGTSATLGGDVTADGGASITARGVVYGTSANPTVGGSGVTNLTSTGTTGSFTVNATGLTGSTTYNYRAYATNSVGTSYGSNETFTTSVACALSASITAHSDLNCNGDNSGVVTVTASNGAANYDYVWSNTASTTGSSNTTNTISGLAAGTFTVTVTDSNGCTATASETLTEPALLTGGTISVN